LRVLLFANTEWYLYNFRRSLALRLRDSGHDVILLSPPGPYGEKLREMGFRWIPAPMVRQSLNPVREMLLVRWLRDLFEREQLDLVHSFTIKCAVYGSLAARMADVPARINAVAGMGYVFTSEAAKARILRPVVGALLRLALDGAGARLILQNPDDVALFQKSGLVRPERIRLIPGSGVDCNRFAPESDQPQLKGADRFRVLLPARLLWDKGIAEYVDAARQLRSEGRAVDFLLAGDPDPGNPAAVSEQMVRSWVSEGLIDWLGHVKDMPALFRSVDAVTLPSYREGLPKGLIEAAASGLPLITTDAPGCREVVTHERDGLLVPVKDWQNLAQAIARLQDDPMLRRRLGSAARAKALRLFDEETIIDRTLDVYRELGAGF
jgi:glycosyltransferase involved in cell wall biosynthesis